MLQRNYDFLANRLKQEHRLPLEGLVELTYRCDFSCIHCYCRGSETLSRELSTSEWKSIFDELKNRGCLCLFISGGDPFIRPDFLELYAYARARGFLITLLTNGARLKGKLLDELGRKPPYSIEITVHAMRRKIFESVTQSEGSHKEVMTNIKNAKAKGIRLLLKTTMMQINKEEIVAVKEFARRLLRRSSLFYTFDPLILPRLNGDLSPTAQRLSFPEALEAVAGDRELMDNYCKLSCVAPGRLRRNRKYLYQCGSWMHKFYINPFGRLRFCQFSDKFSVELTRESFSDGFYGTFLGVKDAQYRSRSRCRECSMRSLCVTCPARAYLETGSEEAPVEYYCAYTKQIIHEAEKLRRKGCAMEAEI